MAASAATMTDDAIGAKFARLAARWRDERGPESSITRISMHPAYQQIIGMGDAAVPLILQELERAPDHWFWALNAIIGVDPVPERGSALTGSVYGALECVLRIDRDVP
jgi:hypothetical protein